MMRFFLIACAAMFPVLALADGSSNYLSFPVDSTNYPISSVAPGWGTAHPEIGVGVSAPSQYGSTGKRRADHSQLTGNYNSKNLANSLIVYSRYTPTNTTGEYVLVHGPDSTSCWVFKTSTNTPIFGGDPIRIKPSLGASSRAIGEVNEIRWDYSGNYPYRLYFVGRSISNSYAVGAENVGMSFYYIDINPADESIQSAPVLIRDFSGDFPTIGTYPIGGFAGAQIMNDVEGDSSNDSRYWAWQVMNTTLGTGYLPYAFMVYDKQTNAIVGRMQRDCTGVSSCTALDTPATASPYLSRPNMVEITPTGNRVHLNYGRTYSGKRVEDTGTIADGPKACLKDFTDCIRIAADETHSGWAWGANGEEMFIYQNNRNDFIEGVNVASAATVNCTLISDNSYTCGTKMARFYPGWDSSYATGMHFGKIYNSNLRGWALLDTSAATSDSWVKNQFVMMEIKAYDSSPAPREWRIAPSYNVHWDYRSEGSGALNFSGTEIWTTANYGLPVESNANEVYSVALPSDWYSVLSGGAIPGLCGSSNGLSMPSAPVTGLCSAGTASAVTGTGPWSWTCAGSGGGSTANCGATLLEVPSTGNASALVACPVIAGFR